MTAQEVVRRLMADGWYEVKQTGSHRKYKHDTKSGIVTVPMHKSEIPKGTLGNIYRQAGWSR